MPRVSKIRRELKPLSNQELLFVAAYMATFKPYPAALSAGYDKVTAKKKAHLWVRPDGPKPHVAFAVFAEMETRKTENRIQGYRILNELEGLAFSSMGDYVDFKANGGPMFRLDLINENHAKAIKKFTVEEYKEGRGPAARDVKKVTIELYDKRAALVDLGKHRGLFGPSGAGSEAPGSRPPVAQQNAPMWDSESQQTIDATVVDRFQIEFIPSGRHYRDSSESELIEGEIIMEELKIEEQAEHDRQMAKLRPQLAPAEN